MYYDTRHKDRFKTLKYEAFGKKESHSKKNSPDPGKHGGFTRSETRIPVAYKRSYSIVSESVPRVFSSAFREFRRRSRATSPLCAISRTDAVKANRAWLGLADPFTYFVLRLRGCEHAIWRDEGFRAAHLRRAVERELVLGCSECARDRVNAEKKYCVWNKF